MAHDELTVETKLRVERNEENIIFKSGLSRVFSATRYNTFSTVFWMVDPRRTKEDYFRTLVKELTPLPLNLPQATPKPHFNQPFVYLTHGQQEAQKFVSHEEAKMISTELSIDYLLGNSPPLLQHPHFSDFRLLRVYTAYLDFTMEDFTGPWNPESGSIAVLSHNDLSQPIAKLIAETARYPLPAEQLQPILAEKVYRFQKQ